MRRVLRVKFALGLFEHPYVDEGRAKQVFLLPESLELAQTVAEHSFVLLKNAPAGGGKPVLPISGDALLGAGGVRAGPIPMIVSQAVLPSTRCLCGLLKPSLPKIPPVHAASQRRAVRGRIVGVSILEIEASTHPTTFTYDIMNRLTGIIYADGTSTASATTIADAANFGVSSGLGVAERCFPLLALRRLGIRRKDLLTRRTKGISLVSTEKARP